jgi:hypothetical protein
MGSRQGHRLLQIGMALVVYSSLDGFAIPHPASPRIALSMHTLSAFQDRHHSTGSCTSMATPCQRSACYAPSDAFTLASASTVVEMLATNPLFKAAPATGL